jgi:hypothetical protein
MERSSDHNDLATALAEVRPAPRDAFAEELDERVAAGFPRRSRFSAAPLSRLGGRVRALFPQRLFFAAGSAALTAIVIATVIVTGSNSGSGPVALDSSSQAPQPDVRYSDRLRGTAAPDSPGGVGRETNASSGVQSSGAVGAAPGNAELESFATGSRRRAVERSAEISLLAAPADVAGDSAKVFAAVHDSNGIVLHSTTTSGRDAGARFDLLIPSARLGDALAALSAIDEVRSRHEATDDITAPTVSTRERLQESRARIDALLAQLSDAETELEAEAVETELRGERRHAARLRARLASLDRRTAYSRVAVLIESGASPDSGGTWGFDDAIGDAGRILAIAAAVILVGLAILAPIALVALLAWFARRSWLRRARNRALA